MNTQQLRALKAAVLADPACAALAVLPEMGKVAGAAAKDQAIADIINETRPPKIVPREIGDGAIALALGIPAGPVFLLHLEALAKADFEGQDAEMVAQIAVARQAWRSLMRVGFDVGDDAVRAGLDSFVGSILNQEQADKIKALAEVDDPVTGSDVSLALRGPWGDEQ